MQLLCSDVVSGNREDEAGARIAYCMTRFMTSDEKISLGIIQFCVWSTRHRQEKRGVSGAPLNTKSPSARCQSMLISLVDVHKPSQSFEASKSMLAQKEGSTGSWSCCRGLIFSLMDSTERVVRASSADYNLERFTTPSAWLHSRLVFANRSIFQT